MKQVLITGASSGIGQQLAVDYAADGWQVIACGQSWQRLSSLAERYTGVIPLSFNVTEFSEVKRAIDSLDCLPDLIILNAGTCEYIEQGHIDSALFKRVFSVNLFGLLHCIEAMQARFSPSTHLVMVGSTASYLPLPRAEAYGASKAAVAYLANTLALDLTQRGIKVTLVSPGFVETPLTDKNDFPMPMLVTAKFASNKIRQGIAAKKTEIHFPLKFSLLLKCIALMPMRWQRAITLQVIGKRA